jgi:hypothetical protein
LSGGNHVCVFFGWSNFSGFSGLTPHVFEALVLSGWFFACLVGGDWNHGEMYGLMMVNDG